MRPWRMINLALCACCFGVMLGNASLLAACGGRNTSLPKEVATSERAAISPSGKYILVVVAGQDGVVRFQSFQILDRDGEPLFLSPERFGTRHTTYFLWDQDDRVWVYSGDVGTCFLECNASTGEWETHIYVQSNIPAPAFLKKMRPEGHPK